MSNAEGKAKSTMQKYKKVFRIRHNRPSTATALPSGKIRPQTQAHQPFEFRLAALSDGALNQLRLFVTSNLPEDSDFLWVPTNIQCFTWEVNEWGILPLRNLDAWLLEQHLRSRLFSLFGEAIATGLPITRTLIEQIIGVHGFLRDCRADFPQWVALIKEDQASGQLTIEQASARLWQLHELINSLESKLILPQA
ncbi:hypothetical protein [Fibrella forsythiae]|uniref:Uncharacterized protein n=1 Tax=Fibrella forsythiae TaxID=2817061 RepID=A0ABS3JQ30_9BACT|nr:hypothetical protein [Fibrella forsythiae]MBO0951583.1 hypothetical protein [Fibrella forsythiae]